MQVHEHIALHGLVRASRKHKVLGLFELEVSLVCSRVGLHAQHSTCQHACIKVISQAQPLRPKCLPNLVTTPG